jgi:NAD+ synthase
MFSAREVKDACVQWIKDWFDVNGKGCKAVIGISGGKDSSVVAALCVEALGKDRVIGVLMPNHEQLDIAASYKLVDHLGIMHTVINVGGAIDAITGHINSSILRTAAMRPQISLEISEQAKVNLPCRIRMSTLYAVSQSVNGRVANTCNLSEDWIGYSTRYGDSAGDFSPLSRLTVTEVKAIGYELGLPEELIEKVPSDGLCGKTDEDNFGFTYAVLDRYIREGVCDDESIRTKIDTMHERNLFKLQLMPAFEYEE